ncbi:MAG: di-trans,poly-cis-decaprenylcistransferase [Thiotrichales bacterium 32-46-8]|nr:polyprenyl diphosphate synthase [Gammaproteobacteria bacterium]OYX07921.1 MAG: di-trans,poly-cis-decaprenylcistransferase [Thiotrichales bacterium 32-46-8]OYY24614.1 MAG: di-trans,poly-cis-decaprenylcistransferase [Thiotrichales bacterium 35-46-9]OZA75227.1 MAG: di-trans,poly-cis-decaprenylcistransferase [Thiotrichales bacterium 39-47-5]HQR81415.1 polyprenyl diphosphate synthase [Thiotrichales bacterium]
MSDTSAPIPQHIAIIMDGNGRWAKSKGLPRFLGHERGLASVRKVVKRCRERGVQALTLFAFSTENWRRPAEEVSKLMDIFGWALVREVAKLHENNVQLRVIGELHRFSQDIQQKIVEAQAKTAQNDGLVLTIAANYGGRWDMIQAVQAWSKANPDCSVMSLDESALTPYLCLSDVPEPDLLIRTGGEQRISNFMLWQLAYAEFYFTDVLWPNFDADQLDVAIADFARRQRRFGMTGDQIVQGSSIA